MNLQFNTMPDKDYETTLGTVRDVIAKMSYEQQITFMNGVIKFTEQIQKEDIERLTSVRDEISKINAKGFYGISKEPELDMNCCEKS